MEIMNQKIVGGQPVMNRSRIGDNLSTGRKVKNGSHILEF